MADNSERKICPCAQCETRDECRISAECQEYKANWDKYGKSAGYKRNAEMVNQLDKNDIAFIFWDGKSKGTKHTIDLCNKNNIKSIITYF